VDWYDNYELTEIPFDRFADEQAAASTIAFAELQREMTPEIGPRPQDLAPGSHSFPVPYVRRGTNMMFNLIAYQRLLLSDFRAAGGMVEQREFHEPRISRICRRNASSLHRIWCARFVQRPEHRSGARTAYALVPQPEVNYGSPTGTSSSCRVAMASCCSTSLPMRRRVITTLPPSRICRKPNWL